MIFHYIPFSVTTHIYTCRNIHKPQSINPGLEHNRSSLYRIYKNTRGRKPSYPNTRCKTMHKTMDADYSPEIKDQKFSPGRCPGPRTRGVAAPTMTPPAMPGAVYSGGYRHPPHMTIHGKNITHTQHSPTCFLSIGGHRRA